jgi:putative Holliday junction resolvase
MRALGIDYGRVRVGIALSDPTMLLASPLAVITNKGDKTINEVMDIIKINDVGVAVIGLALHMDGAESELSREARAFGARLADLGVAVEFADERFTTKIAANAIGEQFNNKRRGNRQSQRKYIANSVDKVSASVILQMYLDKRRICFK